MWRLRITTTEIGPALTAARKLWNDLRPMKGTSPLLDWNVVVGVKGGDYRAAQLIMARFGPVQRSEIGNVLTLTVENTDAFLEQIADLFHREPKLRGAVTGVVPLKHTFDFKGEEDFAEKLAEIVHRNWHSILKETKFHFRSHRRGLVSEVPRKPDPGENMNDVVDEFGVWGAPLEYNYTTCDFVITVETLRRRAGVSLWSYEDFKRHSFLDIE